MIGGSGRGSFVDRSVIYFTQLNFGCSCITLVLRATRLDGLSNICRPRSVDLESPIREKNGPETVVRDTTESEIKPGLSLSCRVHPDPVRMRCPQIWSLLSLVCSSFPTVVFPRPPSQGSAGVLSLVDTTW